MIIEIKVANYRSVNAEQTLSLVADRATRHPNNLIKRPGYRLLKAVGLFGANASGKSNFVKAIGAMATFVRDSATKMNDGDPILAAEPYRLDSKTRSAPSRFELRFLTDGTIYNYGFSIYSGFVFEEWLLTKPESSEQEVTQFTRRMDVASGSSSWTFNPQFQPLAPLFRERTRINALALSVAARENVKELLPAYRFLSNRIEVSQQSAIQFAQAAECLRADAAKREKVAQLMRDADTGLEELRVIIQFAPRGGTAYLFGSRAEGPFPSSAQKRETSDDRHIVLTSRRDSSGQPVDFDMEKDDSLGTQRLFGWAWLLLDVLERGAFAVIDELDASMHPLLTRKLLELFQNPKANPNGAQLLFTTHDPSLLDQELFRRDQIWLAEKCDGASTFFSLADIQPPIRSTESFLRNYLTGRYGGTPHLGPAFDNLLVGTEA